MRLDEGRLDGVPLHESNDPDVFKADEAHGTRDGKVERQMRLVKVNDVPYMDARDVEWIISTYNHMAWRDRWQLFWCQVAICALIQHLDTKGKLLMTFPAWLDLVRL